MIKVTKDINYVPKSLIPAFPDMFPNGSVHQTSETTHRRRMEIINNGAYINDNNHNDRYKLDDIKEKLRIIYNGKCAFCEQKVEQLHVEHFRPKDTYYWLAYSWDNLVLSCPACNMHKGVSFELNGVRQFFENNEENLRNINNLSAVYDILELPKMVNPEITEPTSLIIFFKDGRIDSTDRNFKYTITTCKLDRPSLIDERRKILNIFKSEIRAELVNSRSKEEQTHAIELLMRQFVRSSINHSNAYMAFRKYAIQNHWLNDIIREMN